MKSLLASVLLTLGAASANAALITYDVDRTIGEGSVVGQITIERPVNDETIVLTEDNIKSWSFTLSAPNLVFGSETIDSDFDVMIFAGTSVSATPTQLTYDFSPVSDSNHLLFLSKTTNSLWCLESTNCTGLGEYSEHFVLNISGSSVVQSVDYSNAIDPVVFAETAVIPVPAAVWLFGSGLLALFGLTRIRR